METGSALVQASDFTTTAVQEVIVDEFKLQVQNAIAAILGMGEEAIEQTFSTATFKAKG